MTKPQNAKRPRAKCVWPSAILLLAGCSSGNDTNGGQKEPLPGDGLRIGQMAAWPTDEWATIRPEDVGMNAALLDEALTYAFEGIIPPSIRGPDDRESLTNEMLTQGVVVIRGGAIVAERYADDSSKDSWAASWSSAKSFTSALIGVLIDQGKISGVDAPMSTFYPEWAGTPKADIKLRDVLQMQSGLQFHEDYFDGTSEMLQMGTAADQLAFMVEREVAYPPGTHWHYSSGDTLLLSGAIQNVTGKNAFDYGKDTLFGPIGMLGVATDWWQDGAGHTLGYCCLDTTTRNFARFGLLFLRDGNWNGQQIVSSEWVAGSTTDAAQGFPGYGYQWWLPGSNPDSPLPDDLYAAEGQDDQHIYVIPSLDLVVVRHSKYAKRPGDAIAENGFISEFLPFGIGEYGTETGKFWLECAFLAPIINSIEGSEKIQSCNIGSSGCREPEGTTCADRAAHYPAACGELVSCICGKAELDVSACDDDCGCREIVQCALESGCVATSIVDCLAPCQTVIDKHGGVGGVSTTLAFDLGLKLQSSGCSPVCTAQ